MKKLIIPFLLFILLFQSCSNGYDYWEISKFNMKADALEDGEEIKLLYTSNAETSKELKYYNQVIVESQKTGDTINILTIGNNGFTQSDGDKIYNYLKNDTIGLEYICLNETERMNPKAVQDLITKKNQIKNVVRDPKFDEIADNNFPTVIGDIGIVTKNQ